MNRIADIHGQIDRPYLLIGLQIVQADSRRRRTAGHESVTYWAKAAAESLACNAGIVDAGEFDLYFVIGVDFERDIFAIAAGIAHAVAFGIVEQEPLTIRPSVVRTGWQRTDFGHLHLAIDMQESIRAQATNIDAGVINVDHVNVIVVNGSWAYVRDGIECVAGPLIVLP